MLQCDQTQIAVHREQVWKEAASSVGDMERPDSLQSFRCLAPVLVAKVLSATPIVWRPFAPCSQILPLGEAQMLRRVIPLPELCGIEEQHIPVAMYALRFDHVDSEVTRHHRYDRDLLADDSMLQREKQHLVSSTVRELRHFYLEWVLLGGLLRKSQ